MGTPGVRVNGVLQLGGGTFVGNTSFSNGADLSFGSGSQILFDDGTSGAPALALRSNPTTGFYKLGTGALTYISSLGGTITLSAFGQILLDGIAPAFALGTITYEALTAGAVMGQYNGTTAQTFQVYGTRTDNSNFERASLSTQTGVGITLAAQTAGTGADNLSIKIQPVGTSIASLANPSGTNVVGVNNTGLGFYNTTPIAKPTGVAVTAAGIHAALVNLGLIAA